MLSLLAGVATLAAPSAGGGAVGNGGSGNRVASLFRTRFRGSSIASAALAHVTSIGGSLFLLLFSFFFCGCALARLASQRFRRANDGREWGTYAVTPNVTAEVLLPPVREAAVLTAERVGFAGHRLPKVLCVIVDAATLYEPNECKKRTLVFD